MRISRKIEFSSAHACRLEGVSEEENRRLYGEAANPHGHGHNYVAEITLEGEPDAVTGMVFDLKELKGLLEKEVMVPYDHRFLNHETPPFDRVVPTAENIARDIWRRLAPHFAGSNVRLYSVRLKQTEDLAVEYFGEEGAA